MNYSDVYVEEEINDLKLDPKLSISNRAKLSKSQFEIGGINMFDIKNICPIKFAHYKIDMFLYLQSRLDKDYDAIINQNN